MRLTAIVAAVLVTASSVQTGLAGPGPVATGAWERCVSETERRIGREFEESIGAREVVGRDGVRVAPVPSIPACEAPDRSAATIQRWRGRVFIPRVTVGAVVESLMSTMPVQDDVLSARVVSRNGDSMRVQMRIVRHAVVTVVYDTEHDVTFARRGEQAMTSRSVMTRIDEVVDAGTPGEHLRSVDADRGFLWRLNSYFQYSGDAGGVRVDLESISLSRGVSAMLRPVARPLIDRIAREAVVQTLDGIRMRFKDGGRAELTRAVARWRVEFVR